MTKASGDYWDSICFLYFCLIGGFQHLLKTLPIFYFFHVVRLTNARELAFLAFLAVRTRK